jgi:hypothetical protein
VSRAAERSEAAGAVTPASSSPTATPAGDDRENRTDEYVVLENPVTTPRPRCTATATDPSGTPAATRSWFGPPDGGDVVSRSCG